MLPVKHCTLHAYVYITVQFLVQYWCCYHNYSANTYLAGKQIKDYLKINS